MANEGKSFELPKKPPVFADVEEAPEAESGKIEGDEGDVGEEDITSAEDLAVSIHAERAKTPEDKATAYANYFKNVKTHEKFLERITAMPADKTLQEVIGIQELEKAAAAAYQNVLVWRTAFEAKQKTIQPLVLVEFAEKAARKLPDGFRGVLRRVVHEALWPEPEGEPKPAKEKEESPTAPPGVPAVVGGTPAAVPAGSEQVQPKGLSLAEAIQGYRKAVSTVEPAAKAAATGEVAPEQTVSTPSPSPREVPAVGAGVSKLTESTPVQSSEKSETLQFKAGDLVTHKNWEAPRRISFVKEEGGVQKAFAGSTTGVPLSELVAFAESKKPEAPPVASETTPK